MAAVGATVVVLKDNKILLNLRSDTKTWGIPGGAAELGETLEETAARDLHCCICFRGMIFISNIQTETSFIPL